MAESGNPLVADSRQFVFLRASDEYGVLLHRPYYELLVRFEHARRSAGTCGEMLNMLGPNAAKSVLVFAENDERVPEQDDTIESLRDVV